MIALPIAHWRYSEEISQEAETKLFEKSPDLIAVFTGDRGRIKKALEISLKHPASKILISGVYSRNNLKILLDNHFAKEVNNEKFDFLSRVTELDFEAQNTRQNVEKTIEFINDNHGLNDILIISSDYHLPRIKLILNLLNQNQNLTFYLQGINTGTLSHKIYHIFLEHLKILNELLPFK